MLSCDTLMSQSILEQIFLLLMPSWTWQFIVIGLQGNAMRFYDLTNALLELEEFQQNPPSHP